MNDIEKSDSVIVPLKRANKGGNAPAESVEGRALAKGNTRQTTTTRTQSRDTVSSGLAGVRKAARKHKQMQFTALLHHVTVDQLRDSYHSLKRQAAPGIDGMTWAAYGEDLERRLEALHRRLHQGSYRAQPARRVYIPKADGSQRALSVWCLEDKIVQQALTTVLNAIYEIDFLGFSYGFRPGRGQHDALDALTVGLNRRKLHDLENQRTVHGGTQVHQEAHSISASRDQARASATTTPSDRRNGSLAAARAARAPQLLRGPWQSARPALLLPLCPALLVQVAPAAKPEAPDELATVPSALATVRASDSAGPQPSCSTL